MQEGFFSYLCKRLLLAFFTLFIILGACYFLMRLAPGEAARSSMIGEGVNNLSSDKTQIAVNHSLREKLHLDKPIYAGFFFWLKAVICHGDFGESVSVDRGRSVTVLIAEALPVTLKLNFLAILLTYFLAIPLGVFSAVKSGSFMDRTVTFLLFFLYSLPVLWAALMLQSLLCKGGVLPIFPLKGLGTVTVEGKTTWEIFLSELQYCVLPVFCLSYAGFAGLSRFTRAGMLEVIQQDYIRTARAKGATEFSVIFYHAFRNAIILMITLFAAILPGLASGSILVEYIFNIPGMGSLSMMALSSRDLPLLMGLFAFTTFLTLGGIFISDCLYVLADPRITFRSRE